MLIINLDEKSSIAMIEPTGALDVKDFQAAASTIDPFIEKRGELKGLFIQNHFLAGTVTDSPILTLVEALARHFIAAQIKCFAYDELDQSRQWIVDSDSM